MEATLKFRVYIRNTSGITASPISAKATVF